MLNQSRILVTMLFLLTASFNTFASDDPIYTGMFSNKALDGYDTVAYFKVSKAVKGSSKYSTEYKGATWLFSSKENLEAFVADPEKYAPQYGGYCAYAISKDKTASGDPELWSILDDKLYLNYNESILKKWDKDKQNIVMKADKNWPAVLD